MKIIFFGSGEIAVNALRALLDAQHEILCVVTSLDKKQGRHLALRQSPLKEFALMKELPVLQPENLNNKNLLEKIDNMSPDVFVVFSYGKILPQSLLDIPKRFPLNIHASLLPRYRGAAPINWALMNGEEKTGITIIKMDNKMDSGHIVFQEKMDIKESDNALTLEVQLSLLAAQCIIKSLQMIDKETMSLVPQNQKLISYAPKLTKKDGKINWNLSALKIKNQIRGCYSWPGAFTHYQNKVVKIWEASAIKKQIQKPVKTGEVIDLSKNGIVVATGDDFLLIKELQLSSGKRLMTWQFLQGHSLQVGHAFR